MNKKIRFGSSCVLLATALAFGTIELAEAQGKAPSKPAQSGGKPTFPTMRLSESALNLPMNAFQTQM